MVAQNEYKVDLEVFEGPLDLLLYLIKKEEVNIYNIPIEQITSQYMEYLDLMRMLDLNIAGEFIVMAATLIMIKSRMLLPVEDRLGEEDEEDDPRWDLVRQLVEYKKFKDAASNLHEREVYQENIFALGGKSVLLELDESGLELDGCNLFDLITAFNNVLKKAENEEIGEIFENSFTVADKIDLLLYIIQKNTNVAFLQLFSDDASRHEVICTFLALLELIRLKQVSISQKNHFGEIIVSGIEPDEDEEQSD